MRTLKAVALSCLCACTSALHEARIEPAVPAAPPPPLELPATSWSEAKKTAHVLNRLAYGPATQDAAEVQKLGVGAWIAQQLHPGFIHDDAVDSKLRKLPTLTMSIPEAEAAFPPPQAKLKAARLDPKDPTAREQLKGMMNPDELPRRVAMELASAKLIRAVESRRQLQEVLTDFWFNHFNVSAEKGAVKWMITSYERDAIRPHLFGTFRDLLGATAHHPAMLFYLDNWQSVRDGFDPHPRRANPLVAMNEQPAQQVPRGINENYARELLELHTLGVNGGYTQDDVRETARAFTGWSIEKPNKEGTFVYRARTHDPGPKVILGMQLPAGGGIDDGERVLDMLANHPATAHFIATKLCKKFVADDPPPELVERVANVFLQTGGDLSQVYTALFTSPEFWSDPSFGSMTKKPFEVAVSAVRALGGWMDGTELGLYRQTERMGESLYRAQPPTGYPESGVAWVNAGALVSRINFGIQLAANRVAGAHVDVGHLVPPHPGADLDWLVATLSSTLLQHPLSDGTRATIRRALNGADEAMPDGEHRPVDPRLVAGLLLGSPEFQKQ